MRSIDGGMNHAHLTHSFWSNQYRILKFDEHFYFKTISFR